MAALTPDPEALALRRGLGERPPMLARVLEPQAERLYAVLRIVAGLMFSFHGLQKVFGVFTTKAGPAFGTQLWLGGVIELVAGLLIAVGLATRVAAFLASGTMAVAYVQFHWAFGLGEKLLPGINKGELAVLYAFLFLFIAARGSGPWSLDGRRGAASRGGRAG